MSRQPIRKLEPSVQYQSTVNNAWHTKTRLWVVLRSHRVRSFPFVSVWAVNHMNSMTPDSPLVLRSIAICCMLLASIFSWLVTPFGRVQGRERPGRPHSLVLSLAPPLVVSCSNSLNQRPTSRAAPTILLSLLTSTSLHKAQTHHHFTGLSGFISRIISHHSHG